MHHLAILMAVSVVAPADPQTSADASWSVTRRDGVSLVSLTSPSGQMIAVRCSGKTLDVMMTGLSSDSSTGTMVLLIDRAGARRAEPWFADGARPILYSTRPAYTARSWRSGGTLRAAIASLESPPPSASFVIPAASEPLDQVITDCGVPLEDARDRYPVNEPAIGPNGTQRRWDRLPGPLEFPDAAFAAGVTSGQVYWSCLVGDRGELQHCRVEVERPAGLGFGEAVLRGLRAGRLSLDAATAPGQIVVQGTSFRLEGQ